MPKKETKPDDIILTITLPPGSSFRKSGTLIARQGGAAVMHEFEYTDMTGIAAAIQTASARLAERRAALKVQTSAPAASKQPGQNPDPATPEAPSSAVEPSAGDDAGAKPDDAEPQDETETDADRDDPLALVTAAAPLDSHETLDGTQTATQDGQLAFL